jgi:hypothetical protein
MDKQPLISIPELFQKSFELYKPRFWKMFSLVLIGFLGTLVIALVFGVPAALFFMGARTMPILNLFSLLLLLVGALLIIALNLSIQVALMYMLREENVGKGVKEMLLSVMDKMGSYYWIAFLNGFIVLIGFILFIVPGIIFLIRLSFAQYAFVFENARGLKALKYSQELTRGYWWAILGRVLILFVISMMVSSVTRLGFLLNSLFVMPFGLAYFYVIYEDLKRIKASALQV